MLLYVVNYTYRPPIISHYINEYIHLNGHRYNVVIDGATHDQVLLFLMYHRPHN